MSAMIKTPLYTHMQEDDYEKVYEPAEDTFLLIDALEKDQHLIKQLKPLVCMEIGPGSGILISCLAQLTGSKTLFIGTDINPHACICSRKTGEENNVVIETCVDDLAMSFKQRLKSRIDIILFNPPYVVTPSEEVGGNGITASWAGGKDGREVVDRFLPVAASLISPNGYLYILLLKENNPDEVISIMQEVGFSSCTVIERRSGSEHLSVIRFHKAPP